MLSNRVRESYFYEFNKGDVFELKEEHFKLLENSYFDWNNDSYDGALYVGTKRPYGNSDVVGDIADILSIEQNFSIEDYDVEHDAWYEEHREEFLQLHYETHIAVKIVTNLRTFVAGEYIYDGNNGWYKSQKVLAKEESIRRGNKIDLILEDESSKQSK